MNLNFTFSAIMVAAILALGVGLTLWDFDAPAPGMTRDEPALPRFSTLAIAGNMAYDRNCASCHGVNARGGDRGPPLLHDIYNPGHHNDDSFYRAASRGTPQHHWKFGDMPPQPQASRRQIAAIIRYIRELQEANGIVWKKHTM